MSEFTPGPWKVKWGRKYSHIISDNGDWVMETLQGKSTVRMAADARLIAQSPAMYEALEELVILMDDIISGDYKPDSLTMQPARLALAACRGEDDEGSK